MNILLTNDDGINARGINELGRALSEHADIYVCAPHTQKSACGHGITIHGPIVVEEMELENVKRAYSIEGTPADCVKIGLKLLKKEGIDINMVYSGINHGGNMGTDTLYSGTVSAAVEGALCGKPSVAVSIDNHHPQNFNVACELAVEVIDKIDFTNIDASMIININTPDFEKVKGVMVTTLGVREYEEWFEEVEREDGKKAYRYAGKPISQNACNNDIDVIAVENGYASITPLHYDLTDYELITKVKEAGIERK